MFISWVEGFSADWYTQGLGFCCGLGWCEHRGLPASEEVVRTSIV